VSDVTVMEVLLSEPLVLRDGASQILTLVSGYHEVEVHVKAEGGVRGTGCRSLDSAYPAEGGEKQEHRALCHLEVPRIIHVLDFPVAHRGEGRWRRRTALHHGKGLTRMGPA
jgi:hypothetical protein